MPRTHAPLVAAALGAGLVLVATRSPEVDATTPTHVHDAVSDSVTQPLEPSVTEAFAPAESTARRDEAPLGDDSLSPSTDLDALVIEQPATLASFRVPSDRLALSAETHTPTRAALAPEGPTVVALVASWCRPCARELPLLTGLADATGARLVLVSLDDVAGPESLSAVIEDLFARAEPSSRLIPRYELRADPEGAWTHATTSAIAEAGGDPGALPQSLLLDADGRLAMLVQGQLDASVAARMATHIAAITPSRVCR